MPDTNFGIPDDDAVIEKALEDASIPTLMMSMIHMSGDARLLDGEVRPAGVFINEYQGYMSEEAKATVRAQALEVIKAFRDGGCKLPPPPDAKTVHRMMNFLVAAEVAEDYVPMMLEEMELDGVDQRSDAWNDDLTVKVRREHKVLVIGGGMSGVLAAYRLQEAGIPFVLIEKNASVGGTWFENRYPGARVDVGNHLYCYSFEPAHHWSEYFSQQGELQQYFEGVVNNHRLQDHIRFGTEVTRVVFEEDSKLWAVDTVDKDGRKEQYVVNSVISAVGQLNRPTYPNIPGIESFNGQWCHSANWDNSIDCTDKTVVVIGSGASAFQMVPTIAKRVAHMTVFQRSAPWMFENPIYHDKVPQGKKWCLQHLPFYTRWFRFLIFWPACDGAYDTVFVDQDWPHQDRSINAMNDMVYDMFAEYIKGQVGDDEDLLAKVIPDYAPMGKRTLQDNGSWLSALKRNNIDLVTSGVVSVSEEGVTAEDGIFYPADIILYATGFETDQFLWPMEIRGRGGVTLADQWGLEPAAYLGITVPNFPNFYCMYGPGTNLAFGGSLIFNGECQIRYIMECLKAHIQSGEQTMECKEDVFADYNSRFRALHAQLVWEHDSIKTSFYQNAEGKVTLLWPWKILDMWRWTKQVNQDDYYLGG
ncbi:flavin-containing monooxygenase [Candidatus Marimicrobium litorale]|uniref:FAD-binding protein n=1 Tax=Candidatus Marimicrobium litorale TaxID=2518991 RepID=A0ABT3T1Q8_9GAMM|nr:NAD(P)/FAD-dependent oxidoreductase [Candidatus Marimicrobium litorale]MCX2976191.1 FAD-binding protein [Candidatus Marimicrobium litorale]